MTDRFFIPSFLSETAEKTHSRHTRSVDRGIGRQPAQNAPIDFERCLRVHDRVVRQCLHVTLEALNGYVRLDRRRAARIEERVNRLARQPQVLLLDEPFGALDEVTRADMQHLLLKVNREQGSAAVLITHDIDEALLLSDRILLLGNRPARTLGEWRIDLPSRPHGGEIM